MTEVLVQSPLSIPDILKKRHVSDEYAGKRLMENEEVLLLMCLDEAGNLNSGEQLELLMALMIRLTKMDHKILCLEVLLSRVNEQQLQSFVTIGGYRILKRWFKEAEDEKHIAILRMLVQLCKKLPFDSTAIKRMEIGKVIKKLQKFQSSSTELPVFQQDVTLLVDYWKEQAAIEKKVQQEKLAAAAVQAESATTANNTVVAAAEDSAPQVEAEKSNDSIKRPTTVKEELNLKKSNRPLATPLLSLLSANPNVNNKVATNMNGNDTKISVPTINRERKSFDMVERAKNLLAQQTTSSGSSSTQAGSNGDRILSSTVKNEFDTISSYNSDQFMEVEIAKVNFNQKPLAKGGLRKPSTLKEKKRTVQWADEAGGLLREIHTIEVDKIKSTVASYKSHKDLVRKEKQLEKDTYLSKVEDLVMQPTIPWSSPKNWSLPIEVLDNIGVIGQSADREKQNQRISDIVETRYLDDSLIPSDPDEIPALFLSSYNSSDSNAMNSEETSTVIISTPWNLDGEESAPILPGGQTALELQQSNMNTLNSNYNMMMNNSSTNNGYTNSMNNNPADYIYNNTLNFHNNNPLFMGGPTVGNANDLMFGFPNNNSNNSFPMDYGNFNNMNGFIGIGPGGGMEMGMRSSSSSMAMPIDDDRYAQFVNSLPPALQYLDPMTLSMLARDPSLVNSLLQRVEDPILGSAGGIQVDTTRVAMLQSASSIEEYRFLLMNSMNNNNSNSSNFTNWNTGNNQGNQNASPNKNNRQRFGSSSKAGTACHFFNTPKGCANGEKCPFGHFLDASLGGGMDVGAMNNVGPGNRNQGVGPGARMGRNNINNNSNNNSNQRAQAGPGGRANKRQRN